MFFLYLSTLRASKERSIIVKANDKRAIFLSHPPHLYDNELLEQCKDEFHVKARLPIIRRSYGDLIVDAPFNLSLSLKERIRLGFKIIWHFSDGVRKERSIRMIENNPNKNGLSDEHRMKISLSKKGKPSGRKGKKASDEHLERMSLAAKGNKACSGLLWCHEPISGKHKRIKDRSLLPPGWIMGRDPGFMHYARSLKRHSGI